MMPLKGDTLDEGFMDHGSYRYSHFDISEHFFSLQNHHIYTQIFLFVYMEERKIVINFKFTLSYVMGNMTILGLVHIA
jgi:hypothetical protein